MVFLLADGEWLYLEKTLAKCRLCLRSCGVNRLAGELGFCKAGKEIKVARAALHYWEEPCISGKQGSGTVFFSNCNLRCVFCQNHPISHQGVGKEIPAERLSQIFLELQEQGAHNINLVTPTHYVPQIIRSLEAARQKGLNLPVVYNTNSYESIETVKLLQGHIDVYLPDLKYFGNQYAKKYSGINNYFSNASQVVNEMFRQVGEVKFNKEGLIQKGVLIRHLMLPGLLFDSKKVVDYIYNHFGDSVYISLMNQYTPLYNADKYNEINRPLNPKHYDGLIEYCIALGIRNAYIQETGAASEDFVPEFQLQGV